MPVYTYRCENGHEFEDIRPMADSDTAICPVKIPAGADHLTCEAPAKKVPSSSVTVHGNFTPRFYPR